MYRPQEIQDIMRDRNLLDVALDVHMTKTGAYDRSVKDQDNDIKVIEYTLDNWKKPIHSPVFDNAVKILLLIALNEKYQ